MFVLLYHVCISCGFSSSHVWMWELDYKESRMLKNWCFWAVVLEKTLESPLNIHWKELCWSWNSNTLATWSEELIRLKRPWCRERLRAGGEGDDRWRDGWMASLTQWTWVWESSRSWWWTGKAGMPKSMGSQRVRHDWLTELNLTETLLCGMIIQVTRWLHVKESPS